MTPENILRGLATTGEDFSDLLESEMMMKLQPRIVFSPGETINTWDRVIQLRTLDSMRENDKEITRGRFIRVTSFKYRARKIDAETLDPKGGTPSFTVETVINRERGIASREVVLPQYIKYAKDAADELTDSYNARGVVDLTPLAALKEAGLIELEKMLLPVDDKGDVVPPANLIDFDEWLLKLTIKNFGVKAEVKRVIDTTIKLMRDAVRQAMVFQSDRVGKIETELFNRRHNANATGVMSLDDLTLHYFAMLKRQPQDRHLSTLSDMAQASMLNTVGKQGGVAVSDGRIQCPLCTATIPANAVVCPNCQNWIDDDAELAYNEAKAAKAANRKGKNSKQ